MFALIFFGHYVVISVFLFTFALKISLNWTNEASPDDNNNAGLCPDGGCTEYLRKQFQIAGK